MYSGWCFGYGNRSLYVAFKEKLDGTAAKAAVKELSFGHHSKGCVCRNLLLRKWLCGRNQSCVIWEANQPPAPLWLCI